ncbi:MAG: alpha-amylase/4-alpha-glucanotransferase domain-containing protein [Spirochaetia bacterium]|jgi:alpha-amylase
MAKTRIIVGTHNHILLGRDDAAAESLYQESCKPLLAVLYRYPDFPVALHYSGILMEWLEERHPEFLTLLGEMVGRGQVEILGGGYYDPILPLIPMNDKLGQLEKMTTWLRVRFETRPRGCWIAEKIWEPSLASVLRASGIDYTFVEDVQFAMAGATESGLYQAFLTEDQGKIITVFPLSSPLTDLAASAAPADAVAFLRDLSRSEGNGQPVAVVLIDGAATAGSLLRNDWLEGFIRLASENAEWLDPATPGQYLRDNPPTRRLFIPSSASADVMRWALAPDRRAAYNHVRALASERDGGGQFVMGGHFRNFLSRYPEAWLMYAKMMNTHILVNQVRGDKYKKKAAQNELWKGQCHHAYWHGGAGGIYENCLRKAVYQSLIEAEKITRATEIFAPSIISVDYDMDNSIEYLYQGSELNAYIHSRGAALFELDFLPASWNYLDTMVDRENGNDADGQAHGGAMKPCFAYQRKAFIDHFFSVGCVIRDFEAGTLPERGDFVAGQYDLVELNRALPELLMRRDGAVLGEGVSQPVRIEKRFVFRPRSIDVYYRVTNQGEHDVAARLGVEINVSLAARSADSGRLFLLDEDRKKEIGTDTAEIDGVQGLLVRDVRNEVSVTLSSALAFRFWNMPVETPAQAPGSGRKEFQSHCFVPLWDLSLRTGETWENHISVGFEKTQSA